MCLKLIEHAAVARLEWRGSRQEGTGIGACSCRRSRRPRRWTPGGGGNSAAGTRARLPCHTRWSHACRARWRVAALPMTLRSRWPEGRVNGRAPGLRAPVASRSRGDGERGDYAVPPLEGSSLGRNPTAWYNVDSHQWVSIPQNLTLQNLQITQPSDTGQTSDTQTTQEPTQLHNQATPDRQGWV